MSRDQRVAEVAYGWESPDGTRSWDSVYVPFRILPEDDEDSSSANDRIRTGFHALRAKNPERFPSSVSFVTTMAFFPMEVLVTESEVERAGQEEQASVPS